MSLSESDLISLSSCPAYGEISEEELAGEDDDMPSISLLKWFSIVCCCSAISAVTLVMPCVELKVKSIPEARIETETITANPI
jgi:hypothetical protein